MDDLATRCRTVATRLSKPHSEHIKDAAFDHLHEAAARIEALTEALEAISDQLEFCDNFYAREALCIALGTLAAIAQPSREE